MIKYYDFSYDSKFWEYHIVSNLVIKNTPFPNGKVLALAAGFESVSTALYLCGFNVLHTDIDLKKCNLVEMYGKISTNVNVLQEDMVTLTNVGNGYDTVYHISSFEHLNQEQRIICLDNSIRILKPGGLMIFTGDAILVGATVNKDKERVADRITMLDIQDILKYFSDKGCKPLGEIQKDSFESWAEKYKTRLFMRTLNWPGTIHDGDVLVPVLFAYRTP